MEPAKKITVVGLARWGLSPIFKSIRDLEYREVEFLLVEIVNVPLPGEWLAIYTQLFRLLPMY